MVKTVEEPRVGLKEISRGEGHIGFVMPLSHAKYMLTRHLDIPGWILGKLLWLGVEYIDGI